MKTVITRTCGAVLLAGTLTGPVLATPTFNASSGNLAASAEFQIVGGNLQIRLTNTSAADVLVPGDVLTALLFTISGNPTLTPVSALLGSGSTVFYDSQPAGGVVGGEWAYKAGLNGAPLGAEAGISSAGFGLFAKQNRFPGPNLAGNDAPGGLEYGIVSAGDNSATGNGGVTGSGGLIKNSVVFTLSGLSTLEGRTISDVSFQYGTALNEPNLTPPRIVNPEPATVALLGSGLLGLAGAARRRNRKSSARKEV